MTGFYGNYTKFLVSVDCIIFGFTEGKLQLLIQKRPYDPGKGMLSLIGGFVKKNESIDSAAMRVLTQFTGLKNVFMQQLGAFGEVERDPGERVISVVYYALINVAEYDVFMSNSHGARWVDINNIPKLCFDHNAMVNYARIELQQYLYDKSVCKNLLPEYFTLTQLQTLHEAILGTTIDKRNFRRSIAEKNFATKTELIDKTTSRRGAYLYKFEDNQD